MIAPGGSSLLTSTSLVVTGTVEAGGVTQSLVEISGGGELK